MDAGSTVTANLLEVSCRVDFRTCGGFCLWPSRPTEHAVQRRFSVRRNGACVLLVLP